MANVNKYIDVRSDGSVVLYQKGNRDGSINKIFQMRTHATLSASKDILEAVLICLPDPES